MLEKPQSQATTKCASESMTKKMNGWSSMTEELRKSAQIRSSNTVAKDKFAAYSIAGAHLYADLKSLQSPLAWKSWSKKKNTNCSEKSIMPEFCKHSTKNLKMPIWFGNLRIYWFVSRIRLAHISSSHFYIWLWQEHQARLVRGISCTSSFPQGDSLKISTTNSLILAEISRSPKLTSGFQASIFNCQKR